MTSATQLTLVPPASNVRSVSYRRLTDEPPGASEWYNMLERLGLKVNYSRLSGEEITKVREGVVETLRTLDKNYYGSFCAEAHGYFNRIEMKEYFQAPGRKNEDILDEEAPFSHVA
ncbi:MAG TPA: hypothetical protein VJI32_00335, partial [Candidatus Nanoarchaeia archaeon]|nr:hypothetical protein [Candidatus Nanoarchaeia archaeon]